MRKRAGLPLLVGALLLGPRSVHPQIPVEPFFNTWGMEDGLSQASMNVLLQDQIGFIWIGTQDGLNRFDGADFRAFRHRRGDTTSLSDDFVLSLARAEGGKLWVGTNRGGLNLFDPSTGEASRYPLQELGPWLHEAEGDEENRPGRTVSGIVPLADGSLVLSTDVGLARFAETMDHAAPFGPREMALAEAGSVPVCSMAEGGGMAGFADGSVQQIDPAGNLRFALSVPDTVLSLRCPRGGPGYLATTDGSVYEFDAGGGGAELLFRVEDPSGGAQPRVADIIRDPEGVLWVATTRGLFAGMRSGELSLVGGGREGEVVPDLNVISLLLDRESGLWIGTWNGLARLDPRARQIRRIPVAENDSPGISLGAIAIHETPDGGILFGTNGAGVDRLEAGWRSGALRFSRIQALEPWPRVKIYDIEPDSNGGLWIATHYHSVIRLGPDGRRARVIPVAYGRGRLDFEAQVYSVFVDHRGEVWAGSRPYGLLRYSVESDRFEPFKGPEGDWRFGSTWVWPIVEDISGRLWVGAFQGGISVINPDRLEIRSYSEGPNGLSDNRVYSLFIGSRGYVWIGTEGGGLNRLDPETDEIRAYTVEDGVPHDHVVGIIEDDDGFLWISTNDGLARFNPEREEFWVFGEGVGLTGARFFVHSVEKTARGELAFGGPTGVTILDPGQLRPDPTGPRVALTNVRIHGRDVPLARALHPDGLDLQPEENFFAFQFAALDFTDPSQNRYKYMLEGLDDDWIDSRPGNLANYTAVRPGKYTFRVEASNADGVWNDDALGIPVRVQTPFYLTWWFLSFSALAIVAFATWVTHGKIAEGQRRLELAARLHDGIGANIAAIIRASERIDPNAPEGDRRFAELDRVKSLARRAQTEMRAAVRILRKGKEGESLEDMIQELRDTADWMLHDNIRYRLDAPEEVPRKTVDWRVRTDICLLMNEALNNVLKHAEASLVEIEAEYEPPFFHLRIKDDGKGFDQSSGSDGNGLALMENHSARNGGGISIWSQPGRGTTIQARMKID